MNWIVWNSLEIILNINGFTPVKRKWKMKNEKEQWECKAMFHRQDDLQNSY